jgi:acyl-CoA-binding protein
MQGSAKNVCTEQECATAKSSETSMLGRAGDALRSTFGRAAFFVQHGSKLDMASEDQSRMTALLKQSTLGDCTADEPKECDEREKWAAWKSLKGMSRLDAMKEYINLLTASNENWAECEKFARETEKVNQLMKELNIREDTCIACEDDVREIVLPSKAYIRSKDEVLEFDVEAAKKQALGLSEREDYFIGSRNVFH